jgi:hypothetical protein
VTAAEAAREANRPTSQGETFRLLAVFARAQHAEVRTLAEVREARTAVT